MPHHTSWRLGWSGLCCTVLAPGFCTDQCLLWVGEQDLSKKKIHSSVINMRDSIPGFSWIRSNKALQAATLASKSPCFSSWTTGILYGLYFKSALRIQRTDSLFKFVSCATDLIDFVGVVFITSWTLVTFSSLRTERGRPEKSNMICSLWSCFENSLYKIRYWFSFVNL